MADTPRLQFGVLLVVAVHMLTSCSKILEIWHFQEAATFIGTLLAEEQLAGLDADDHGEFTVVFNPLDIGSTYPLTAQARIDPDGAKTPHFYTLRKESAEAPWFITAAWTRDDNAQTVSIPIPDLDAQLNAQKKAED